MWLAWSWSKWHWICLLWLIVSKEVECHRNTSFLFKIVFGGVEVVLPRESFYFFYFFQVVLVDGLFKIAYHFALALNIQIYVWRHLLLFKCTCNFFGVWVFGICISIVSSLAHVNQKWWGLILFVYVTSTSIVQVCICRWHVSSHSWFGLVKFHACLLQFKLMSEVFDFFLVLHEQLIFHVHVYLRLVFYFFGSASLSQGGHSFLVIVLTRSNGRDHDGLGVATKWILKHPRQSWISIRYMGWRLWGQCMDHMA